MKLLILNGSPRMKGTTKKALSLLKESISLNMKDVEINFYDISKMNLSACLNCDGCRRNGGTCVVADDGIFLQEKVFEADTLNSKIASFSRNFPFIAITEMFL